VIEVTDADGVAVVRLAHGPVNALDLELLGRITETFAELDAGPCRAVVLTGAGRAFSAGVDLWRIVDGGAGYVAQFLPALVSAFETVFSVGKPLVAAVNGHAIAGGCMLAACCDERLMATGPGRVGMTELPVGVPLPVSALEILAYAIGPRAARDAVLTGATYQAPEAVAHGFVDAAVDPGDLLDRAVGRARQWADGVALDAYRLTKQQLQQPVHDRLARDRPRFDPRTYEGWVRAVADGRIAAYMRRVTGKG
jgi:enoyl-CoA hydratase